MTSSEGHAKKTKEEIAQAYVSEPWWYDVRGFFILTFAYNSTLPAQLRFFAGNFGENHLEAACGTGTLLELVLRWRKWKGLPPVRITGFDYAESMLAGAMHRFADNPLISLEHADAADLGFDDGFFDTANIANSVHCFPDVDGALMEICRVLKPGGTFLLIAEIYGHDGLSADVRENIERYHLYNPTPETFETIFHDAGFSSVQVHIEKDHRWICVEGR